MSVKKKKLTNAIFAQARIKCVAEITDLYIRGVLSEEQGANLLNQICNETTMGCFLISMHIENIEQYK